MGNGSRLQSLKFVRRVAFARRPKPSNWPMFRMYVEEPSTGIAHTMYYEGSKYE